MAPSAEISYHLQSTQILLGDFCRDSLEHKLLKYFSETLWLEISKLVGLDVGLSKHTEVSWKVFSYKFLNLQLIFNLIDIDIFICISYDSRRYLLKLIRISVPNYV